MASLERQTRARVHTVGVDHEHGPAGLARRAIQVHPQRIVERGLALRLPAPDTLHHAGKVALRISGDPNLGVEVHQRDVLGGGQQVQEADRRRSGQLEVALHAAAGIQQQAGMEVGQAPRRRSSALRAGAKCCSDWGRPSSTIVKSSRDRSVTSSPLRSVTVTPNVTRSMPPRNTICSPARATAPAPAR